LFQFAGLFNAFNETNNIVNGNGKADILGITGQRCINTNYLTA
jgi:hypothetical protein